MCRNGLLWLALLCPASPAAASSWADSLFDESSRDFGAVPRGQVLSHPFHVINRTRSTVHISNIRVSCGCTSVRAMQDTLEPGQETVIFAQMDTRRFFGSKSVTVYVQFDQPDFDEVRLVIQANSRVDLVVSPEILSLGRIKAGSSVVASADVTFLGGGQERILSARSDSNYIQIAYHETRRDAGEVSYRVTARIRPNAPPGKWFSDIWLTTDNPSMSEVRVPLTVAIVAPPRPPTIVMGMVRAGGEAKRRIIVRGSEPFRITGVDGTDGQVRIRETNKERKAVHVVTVTLRPDQPGLLNRTLRIHTDLPGAEIEFNAKAQVIR
jgi:hypothetical protein